MQYQGSTCWLWNVTFCVVILYIRHTKIDFQKNVFGDWQFTNLYGSNTGFSIHQRNITILHGQLCYTCNTSVVFLDVLYV